MKPRRPRMTRQLVERLIIYADIAEMEYDRLYEPEATCAEARSERRKAEAAARDKQWLFRMRDWFDARSGE